MKNLKYYYFDVFLHGGWGFNSIGAAPEIFKYLFMLPWPSLHEYTVPFMATTLTKTCSQNFLIASVTSVDFINKLFNKCIRCFESIFPISRDIDLQMFVDVRVRVRVKMLIFIFLAVTAVTDLIKLEEYTSRPQK